MITPPRMVPRRTATVEWDVYNGAMGTAQCRRIEEAVSATAGLGRPQILFTIASRFGGFNWKYSAMCYAAQLKNVGAIYQTMYLVATAMGLGACGLGLGNADRFARMTGHDYATEGSIGEFMIGRPL